MPQALNTTAAAETIQARRMRAVASIECACMAQESGSDQAACATSLRRHQRLPLIAAKLFRTSGDRARDRTGPSEQRSRDQLRRSRRTLAAILRADTTRRHEQLGLDQPLPVDLAPLGQVGPTDLERSVRLGP